MNADVMRLEAGPAPQAVEIAGLACDSRAAKPGFLFAALPGTRAQGTDFIADALARGVAAVLVPSSYRVPPAIAARGVAFVADDNPRRRFALMAARFFGAQPRTVVAVTGTNGKSSVAGFARQIWWRLGIPAASIGTLGLIAPGLDRPGTLTTPDPVMLHQTLRDLAESGVDHLAIEASSHGLDQYRLDGLRLAAAAFTNLSRDHLDYHRGMEAYFKAKLRLFDTLLPEGGVAVLNADAPEHEDLRRVCLARRHRIVGFGRAGKEIRLVEAAPAAAGQRLAIELLGRRYEIDLPLAGSFQAMNALCALGLVVACGAAEDEAVAALALLAGERGRMERVAEHRGATIYVDYAHTPDALEKLLVALRPHARGRLIAVFGCGGDRDPGKRPLMGGIAARLADLAIVTDDNPRGEDAAAIRRAVLEGCAGRPVREIGDRRQAIREAVALLAAGDVLVIAGKGHEQGQIVGDRVLPFDDAAEVRAAVAAEGGR